MKRITDARRVDGAGGGRDGSVVMKPLVVWSRDINVKVTRLATECAYFPAQCDGVVVVLVTCPWG
jgi:hypothetical protein